MDKFILKETRIIGFIVLVWISVSCIAGTSSCSVESDDGEGNVTLCFIPATAEDTPSRQTLGHVTHADKLLRGEAPTVASVSVKPLSRGVPVLPHPRKLPLDIANYCKRNGLLFDLAKIKEDIVFSEDEKPRIDADAEAFILRMEETKKFLIEYAVPWLFKDKPETQAAFWYGLNYHIATFFFDKLEAGQEAHVRKTAQLIVNTLVGLCEPPEDLRI